MCKTILIKPHHFIDIITDFGGGQTRFEPHPYGHAVHTVAERLVGDRDALLEMELGADDICRPCVHNIDGICDDTIDISFRPDAPPSKREYNLLLDRRWCRKLGLAQGDAAHRTRILPRGCSRWWTTSRTYTARFPSNESSSGPRTFEQASDGSRREPQ